ncbi:MAG TPA: bifunctional hydroxymethylpyrimidine kinase/phosphomethylpyrimidine kinase [Acetobacteraceae bacterium]|nr:bifunctional hydroxymethylpyrimidine kinase/phosphomethylpyrimidine kinase [Acetobacteraceae bacterium]
MIANVLSIAGSDPSGGAGIQADLKTFSALGAYGMAVITALTAQNTQGVRSFQTVDPAFVAEQIDAIFADVRVDAVKIGMVASAQIAIAIADRLRHNAARNIVLDPVMVAKSGHHLLQPDAVATLRDTLVPMAQVITPNLPEAGVLLTTTEPASLPDMHLAVRRLHRLGSRWVLLKGGHLTDEASTDLLFDGETVTELPARRIATANTHGTGCTLSSAIAALLPQLEMAEAVRRAKGYLTASIAASEHLSVGSGHGPVHHFHALWKDQTRCQRE